ncbi:MAG: tetratricopeptide repeat protein [Labilithrix sp.]|nr:tetratricopeptide repeat protein [Labilithrix sp.]
MDRSSILKSTGCDLKRLPLGALEAFMLSQLDGQLTLEEIAEICSLGLADASRIAARLLELGAACESTTSQEQRPRPRNPAARAAVEEVTRQAAEPRVGGPPGRVDPRVEKASVRPGRAAARPGAASERGSRAETGAHDAEKKRRRSSRPSLRVRTPAPRGATTAAPRADEPRGHDEALREEIFPRGARLPHLDRAGALDVERAADGATPPSAGEAPLPRKASKSLRHSSRRMSAARKQTPAPAAKAKTEATAPADGQRSAERLRQLRAAAREVEVQARVEPLLRAAELALERKDPIGAANNFRLALQHRDDPFVRLKLEDADRLAKSVRFDRSVACARAAEDDRRWADAAIHYARAHDTRPTAEIADRAANALRASQGDLQRAATLAEQAVALDPKNARFRVTLGEIYLAARHLTRAAAHAEVALEIAPRDARAKELAAAIAKAKREQA